MQNDPQLSKVMAFWKFANRPLPHEDRINDGMIVAIPLPLGLYFLFDGSVSSALIALIFGISSIRSLFRKSPSP